MTKKSATPRLQVREYQALAGFRQVLRQFLAFSARAAAKQGLSSAQHQALLAIKGMPGPGRASVGDLAAWLGVRHHSAVGLVARLVRLGLLHKRVDATDRRRVTLLLTAKAEAMLAALSAAHRAELRRLSEPLGSLLKALD